MAVAFEVSAPPPVELGNRPLPPGIDFPNDTIELGKRVSPSGVAIESSGSGSGEPVVADPIQYWSS